MIVFENASVVSPDGARILASITLTLTQGHVAIIGANGSGKSTLVRLINGLVAPSQGSVEVHGIDTRRHTRRVRAMVGFLFTDPSAQVIMPTAIEDVALSLRRGIPHKSPRLAAALAALEEIGLGEHAYDSVHTLSGGQRQLLAIAGVLATQPRIVVADEPTTLLDLRWRAHVDAMLGALPQQVIEVTHDLDAAQRADRVLVVEDGEIAFDGDPPAAVDFYRALMRDVTSAASP